MMNSYKSDYPNQVHQLAVAASKHYYASKDGILNYQKKPMEVSLASASGAKRRHMIICSLRDHCSGVFYSEITFSPHIPSARAFLHRAWSHKSHYSFHGLPDLLVLPRTVKEMFPSLGSAVAGLNVKTIDATSGFQSGIRDLRTIDENLRFIVNDRIELAQEWIQHTCISHSEGKARVHGPSKIDLWQQHVPAIRTPPSGWGNEA